MSVRKSYEAKADAEFAAVKVKLDGLAAKAQQAVASGKEEAAKLLQTAQAKHDEAFRRLTLLKQSGEEGWETVKTGFETAWADFHKAIA